MAITSIHVPSTPTKNLSDLHLFEELQAVRKAEALAKARAKALTDEVRSRAAKRNVSAIPTTLGTLTISTPKPGTTWDRTLKDYATTSTSRRAHWLKAFLKENTPTSRVLLSNK